MSVFITGASGGIGEACAKAFAAAKHDLVLVARRKDKLAALAADLKKTYGVKVDTFECDVRDRKSVEKLFHPENSGSSGATDSSAVMKSVDVLINNAGLALGKGNLQDGNPDDWDAMIDTNVKGLLYVTRAFLPQLITAKKGHIVNIGSVAGHWVYPGGNVYCASKFAVRALSEGLRMDLLGTGVRVTEIAPGMVETDFSKVRFKGDEEKAKAVYKGLKPLSPADIAETILWCVQRPAHIDIQNLVIFPTAQASVEHIHRS